MDPLTPYLQADEAKLADFRADIRHHELRIASIRRAIQTVEARLARTKEKARKG